MARARLVSFLWLLAGCGAATPDARPMSAQAREGAALYARYCALCHGAEGEGYAADDATRLRGQSLLRTASDRFLRVATAEGRADTAMAAYSRVRGGPLTDGEVDAIVAFLRAWQQGPSIEVDAIEVHGDPERGGRVWSAHCAGCHGTLAEGASAQSLRASTFLTTASDGFLRHAIVHGREDTPMPAFERTLDPQAIDDVVAFLRRMETEPLAVPEHLEPPSIDALALIAHPDGPRPQLTLREGRFVPAAEVRDALARGARVVLLDARPTSEWLRRRIPGAIPVPYYDIEPIVEHLPRDGTWILAYCGCPHAASGQVVDTLRAAGFESTAVIDEGFHHWIEQGYPVDTGPAPAR